MLAQLPFYGGHGLPPKVIPFAQVTSRGNDALRSDVLTFRGLESPRILFTVIHMLKKRMEHGAEQLAQAMAGLPPDIAPSVVLHLGLDNLQSLTGTYGQAAADTLRTLANQRLLQSVREHEAVVQLANDEFAVLLHSVTSVLRAGRAADRLHRLLEQSVTLPDGTTLHVSACVGVALCPEDGCDARSLLHRASIALRHARAAGAGLIQFYEPAMESSRSGRPTLAYGAPSYLSTL